MQLVLDTPNISLRVRNRSFVVSAAKERRLISPHRLSSIAVISPCALSSAAVLLAVAHKIPIIFFDHAGEPEAQVWSTQFGHLAELRRAQVLFAMTDAAVAWATRIFELKTDGQLANLTWMQTFRPLPQLQQMLQQRLTAIQSLRPTLAQAATQSEPLAALLAAEAAMARHYWLAWGQAAPTGFNFSVRSRRPAQDAFNATLNYLYGMLYNAVEGATLAAGLDPMFGLIHADAFGAPTLVFDLIEPFRPCVDRLLMTLLYEGAFDHRHVVPLSNGYTVQREGRKILIAAFNDMAIGDNYPRFQNKEPAATALRGLYDRDRRE